MHLNCGGRNSNFPHEEFLKAHDHQFWDNVKITAHLKSAVIYNKPLNNR
jgi:hypothetical protein